MLKHIFVVIFSVLLCSRSVFSQWEFAVTARNKIMFFDEKWTEVTSAAHNFEKLSAIAFDETQERIFFNDEQHDGNLFSLKIPLLKGKQEIDTILAQTKGEDVEGIAYDPLEGNIYWTDKKNQIIFSLPAGGGKTDEQKVIFNFTNDGTFPDGIAVDTCRRKLYWTNSNSNRPSIETASLDGKYRETLISSDLYLPHGIAVDQFSDRIYYVVDQRGVHFSVESANLDGTDRQVIYKGLNSWPLSLTITKDGIYWTDLTRESVWMMPKVYTNDTVPIRVKHFNYQVRGIVSRVGFMSKLKSDEYCKDVVEEIQNKLLLSDNRTNAPKKELDEHIMICLNKGLYIKSKDKCSCNEGYSGSRCETKDCHNYCINGKCGIKNGSPNCTCHPGYEGERCETYKCSNYCMNGGKCSQAETNAVCKCEEGFLGRRCETNATEACSPFCSLLRKDVYVDNLLTACSKICKDLHVTDDEELNTTPRIDRLNLSCQSTWNKSIIVIVLGVVCALMIIYMIIMAVRRFYKPERPRIRKTFVVKKNVSQTPLTCRPIATEQCEITIENCCNMNICDTPCFDPKLLQQNMNDNAKKEDKEVLIHNMDENF